MAQGNWELSEEVFLALNWIIGLLKSLSGDGSTFAHIGSKCNDAKDLGDPKNILLQLHHCVIPQLMGI